MTEQELIRQASPFELKRLEQLESTIETAMRKAYMDTGAALAEIRNNDLYKLQRPTPVSGRYNFTTWEEYTQERWSMGKDNANRLIAAADVASKMMTKVTVLPAAERHVRELLKLDDDDQRLLVWKQVVDAASGKNITAARVKEAVDKFKQQQAKNWITLDEWHNMDDAEREGVWTAVDTEATMGKQTTDAIEWAQWSWNPITGCKHNCPYCYARDIAERFLPQEFAPSLYPYRLYMPANTEVPQAAEIDTRFRNVFTGSMADMFGKWVPKEWIEQVLSVMEDNPQWNFLTLTKFPHRLREFSIPNNAWMGTTVDMQARVAAAERAFLDLDCGVKWLSVEPMLEPLTFLRLDAFDWVVVGGCQHSKTAPSFRPPFEWVMDLVEQCRNAGVKVYMKTNLFGDPKNPDRPARILELPFDAPIVGESYELPGALRYLGNQESP
jgi:protein gp37